jgi:hypothetical protein
MRFRNNFSPFGSRLKSDNSVCNTTERDFSLPRSFWREPDTSALVLFKANGAFPSTERLNNVCWTANRRGTYGFACCYRDKTRAAGYSSQTATPATDRCKDRVLGKSKTRRAGERRKREGGMACVHQTSPSKISRTFRREHKQVLSERQSACHSGNARLKNRQEAPDLRLTGG